MTLWDLREILAGAIAGSEFAAVSYFAGGCVRDLLLAEAGMDIPADVVEADIAVEADAGGEALALYLSKVLPAGKPVVYQTFGTASLVWRGIRLEFVMTRCESYRHRNRKPSVTHASLAMDASRRDFGINALYMRIIDGEIIDPTGCGHRDIQDRVIRCVGAPGDVFGQDPLRMLRAIRFSARFGFPIDPTTWQGINASAASIRHISHERIADEFNLIITHPNAENAARGVELAQSCGLMKLILPELAALVGLKQNRYHHLDAFGHTLEVLKHTSAGLYIRWAALLHDIGKAATHSIGADGRTHFYGHEQAGADLAGDVLLRFRVPASGRASITRAIKGHMLFKQSGPDGSRMKDATLRRCAYLYGKDMELLLELCHADNLAHHPDTVQPMQIPGIRARLRALKDSGLRFSLTGKDIMRYFGISEGIRIGEMLAYARDKWFHDPTLEREKLLQAIARRYRLKKEPD